MLLYSVEMHCLANVRSKIKKGVTWFLQLSVEEASSSVARDYNMKDLVYYSQPYK